MAKKRQRRKNPPRTALRSLSAKVGAALFAVTAFLCAAGNWYVHHSAKWLDAKESSFPGFITGALSYFGYPCADVTDALGLTGHDVVYEYDEEAPSGSVFFAGAPKRTGLPAPDDIVVLDRGEFKIGWSAKLRHPVWCAYHVTKDAKYFIEKRPSFTIDRSVPSAPKPGDYTGSGYDRGHMAPNHAISSRYGQTAQKLSFMMSNIAPQTPALNRGVWREVEHRIADLWTRRYGEIWVVVGAISTPSKTETVSGSDIDVPTAYYQVIIAQTGFDVRALALCFDQHSVEYGRWPSRHLISIDELEEKSGLDFNPDLPGFISSPLEAELPSRLWPVGVASVLRQLLLHYRY